MRLTDMPHKGAWEPGTVVVIFDIGTKEKRYLKLRTTPAEAWALVQSWMAEGEWLEFVDRWGVEYVRASAVISVEIREKGN